MATPGRLTQTLGPWELTAPDSATLIAGGGSSFGWLNVLNGPLTINQAMTSSPIENGAYANADIGTTVEVVFTGGVVNGPGADLVMLDAQFDAGHYSIRSDFDGFVASAGALTDFGIFSTSLDFFYEHNPAGPFAASVVGVEVDLTTMGVPAGATVTALRFTCDNAACDPVTLAKIGDSFTLTISPLIPGSVGTFDATGGTPSGTIGIGYSLAGNGPALVNTGSCGLMSVDLTPPIGVLTMQVADANGDISLSATVPASVSGRTAHFQALDFGSCTLSNGVTQTIP